ncbi:histidine phosphatase family protein [Marimonas lutisalis]|uniref:histidine phosphatase family protein n=1 Tax=Marimonas lutisalis TaxID=2545756 RepID=UPI0010F5CFB4|nr:histidine phosphatase family protein [Marimonas lutisalis]
MFRYLMIWLLAILPFAVAADDWDALKRPDAIVLMRHALAPGGGDPAGFRLDDCTTQRNLDERGRDQARRIGAELQERGVGFDAIWSSQWCRCRETADLLQLGDVAEVPALNSFFQNRERRGRQTHDALALLRESDGRRLLVTHQVNITALTGVFPRSGEIVVTQMRNRALEVTGRILIDP